MISLLLIVAAFIGGSAYANVRDDARPKARSAFWRRRRSRG